MLLSPAGTSQPPSSSALVHLLLSPWGSLQPPCLHPPAAPVVLCLLFCPQLGTLCRFNFCILFTVCGLSSLLVSSPERKLLRPRLFVCFVLRRKLSVWHMASDNREMSLKEQFTTYLFGLICNCTRFHFPTTNKLDVLNPRGSCLWTFAHAITLEWSDLLCLPHLFFRFYLKYHFL